jgi:hypothetical protein
LEFNLFVVWDRLLAGLVFSQIEAEL